MRSVTGPLLVGGALAGAAGALGLASIAASAGAGRRRTRSGPVVGGCPPWFTALAGLAGLPGPAERAWPWFVAAAAVMGGWLVVVAPSVLVVGAIVVGLVPAARRRVLSHAQDPSAELVEVLDSMVAELRTGSSLVGAAARTAERPGRAGTELAQLRRRVAAGQGVQDAFDAWATGRGGDAALVADALAIAAGTGASQAQALHAVATTVRQRQARRREVRALASQARASGVVLVVTPVAFAAVVAVVDPRVGRFLVGDPGGWACLFGGVALDAIGAGWMASLIRRVR